MKFYSGRHKGQSLAGYAFVLFLVVVVILVAIAAITAILPKPNLADPNSPESVRQQEVIYLASIGLNFTHGDDRHPEAPLVRSACAKGPSQLWRTPLGQYIRVCQLEDGRWGVQIVKRVGQSWEEVTAYIRDAAKTIEDVEKWLEWGLNELVWPR